MKLQLPPLKMFLNARLWATMGAVLLGLIACQSVNRTVLVVPQTKGAEFVGNEDCTLCHEDVGRTVDNTVHARLMIPDEDDIVVGCEACHGPGSLHSMEGEGRHLIHNPGRSPESCLQCHLDVQGQFALPHSHPVAEGMVACIDCHDPHGDEEKELFAEGILAAESGSCAECHPAQAGPFVFEHEAMRDIVVRICEPRIVLISRGNVEEVRERDRTRHRADFLGLDIGIAEQPAQAKVMVFLQRRRERKALAIRNHVVEDEVLPEQYRGTPAATRKPIAEVASRVCGADWVSRLVDACVDRPSVRGGVDLHQGVVAIDRRVLGLGEDVDNVLVVSSARACVRSLNVFFEIDDFPADSEAVVDFEDDDVRLFEPDLVIVLHDMRW